MEKCICCEALEQFRGYLICEEKSEGTVEKYLRDVGQFFDWTADRPITKEAVNDWKTALIDQGLTPGTVNGKLASLNCYLKMTGMENYRVKSLKIQRRMFRDTQRDLSKKEYEMLLVEADRQGKERLKLIMETICATGIRVSELRYITVESTAFGRTSISLKGKIRTILLPPKLCRKLRKYSKKQKIWSGEIFRTRAGNGLSRKQIWAQMKALCEKAGVKSSKVFPHNLRHLFARCFYRTSRDVVKLADVLGHSSVETTRIYLISTGEEHAKALERLRLIS